MNRPVTAAVMALLALGAVRANAQPELEACARILSAPERLACYDRTMRALKVPQPPASQLPAPPPDSAQTFGAEVLPPTAPAAAARINRIVSPIQAYAFSPTGHFTITLANGQVWRQMEGDNSMMRFRHGRTLLATVSRGAFGSYDLVFSDHSVIYKVTRVR